MSDLWPTLRPTAASIAAAADWDNEPEFTAPSEHTCPTCEDTAALETAGSEVVCTRCGTIVDIPLEWAAEYRWFSAENSGSGGGTDPSRTSFPVNHLMPESSLGTTIICRGNSAAMRKIKRYHMWNQMPYRERALWSVFDGLQVRASNAGIGTAVVEEAKELYAQLTASAICRGQAQRDAMLAACLWESLKRHETPRMPRDVADIFTIPLKSVTKGIKQFQHLLAMRTSEGRTDTYAVPLKTATATATAVTATASVPQAESDDVIAARALQRRAAARATRTTSYEDFIVPFLTNMSVSRTVAQQLEAMVRRVCARTEELNIVPENTPPSLTASVIAFCMGELGLRVDQNELARVCGISAVTIQKCIKRLSPKREMLLTV
jgi:transcription initiation factor TFIIB